MTTSVMSLQRLVRLVSLVLWMVVGLAAVGLSSASAGETSRPAGAKAAGQWTQTGSLITGRHGHSATRLRDGTVLVAGGRDDDYSAETYDPMTRTWSAAGRLNQGRTGHTATLLADGRVLVAGGWSTTSGAVGTRAAELYDPATRIWAATGDTLLQRGGHTATLLPDGRVLVVGGLGRSDSEATAEIYDPATGRWSATGTMGVGRSYHSATLLADGKVLVVGGMEVAGYLWDENSHEQTAIAELYDPSSGTWTRTGDLNQARQQHAASLLLDGKVLVAGGFGNSVPGVGFNPRYLKSAESFDPVTGEWTTQGSLPDALEDPQATTLPSGNVLVIGGSDPFAGVPRVDFSGVALFDLGQATWARAAAHAPDRRSFATLTPLSDGSVLAVGGRTEDYPGVPVARADLYKPAFSIDHRLTGSWFDPNQSGHGLVIQVLPQGRLLAWWYSFNPAGTQQAWFGGVGTYSGNTATISNVARTTGGRWIPNFDPRTIVNSAWGTFTLTFSDLDHGRVDFSSVAGFGSGSMNLTRITRPLLAPTVAREQAAGTIGPGFTGVWFNPSQSGHGLSVEVLPDNRVSVWWFTFNPEGTEQAWFGGLGTYQGNTAVISEVTQPTGGRWIPNFNPQQVSINPWGSLTLSFRDCAHGTVTFNSTRGYGSGSLDIEHLGMPLGQSCP